MYSELPCARYQMPFAGNLSRILHFQNAVRHLHASYKCNALSFEPPLGAFGRMLLEPRTPQLNAAERAGA